MDDLIIVAIIGFLGNALVSWMSNNKTAALMNFRLDILEKKQDKYNNVIERTYLVEKDLSTVHTEMQEMRSDIEELKGKVET